MNSRALRLLLLVACACGGPAESESHSTSGGTEPMGFVHFLMNGGMLASGLYVGGQPSDTALNAAPAAGIVRVITLRTPEEPGFEEERAAVEELGMSFVSIPVAGAAGLTESNARALDAAIAESGEAHTLVHCGTSNRAGALLALRAFYVNGASVEEALEYGRLAGMTGLEPQTRAHLEGAERP